VTLRPAAEVSHTTRRPIGWSTLTTSARLFDLLESAIEREVRNGHWREAAGLSAVATRFAARCHPGRFVSLPIERSLASIGHQLESANAAGSETATVPEPAGRGEGSPTERVLHVITRPEVPGGHTNWLKRWVVSDRSRVHSMVVVDPAGCTVPPDLRELFKQGGGDVIELAGPADDLIGRAGALRAVTWGYDFVVLASHPHDIVPTLALSGPIGRPPVLTLNHSDHLFWVGAGISDVLVEFRGIGASWSRNHRGYPLQRQIHVPLPVEQAVPMNRSQARRELGLEDDAFVVVSVGSPYKYEPIDGLGFLQVMSEGLHRIPSMLLLVVGPSDDGEWAATGRSLRGRVRAVGPQLALAPYFAAADAYVNSYPVGSTLALLDAAAAGLPVVSILPKASDRSLIGDDPACPEGLLAVGDSAELAKTLAELREDPELRQSRRDTAREHIERVHAGEGWRRNVEAAYAAAASAGPMSPQELGHSAGPSDVDDILSRLGSHTPCRTLLGCAVTDRAALAPALRFALAVPEQALRVRTTLRTQGARLGVRGRSS
jgi:glycosyltransferase involved in cell wall biosynthesis